jgi:hypothetical protein
MGCSVKDYLGLQLLNSLLPFPLANTTALKSLVKRNARLLKDMITKKGHLHLLGPGPQPVDAFGPGTCNRLRSLTN